MFLRFCDAARAKRIKGGKEHQYWSVVENRRVADGRIVQRHVLYLGEINDSQQVAWRRSIEIFDQGENVARTVALVPAERQIEQDSRAIVRIGLMPWNCVDRVSGVAAGWFANFTTSWS